MTEKQKFIQEFVIEQMKTQELDLNLRIERVALVEKAASMYNIIVENCKDGD